MATTEERVIRLFDENLTFEGRSPGEPLNMDRNIAETGVSSQDVVAFWKLVNEEFNASISPEQFADLLTPRSLIEYLDARST